MERSRLLLGWLAARRAVDHCLSDLLAAGPAGERRVRESLAVVDDLETRAQVAFDRYRAAAETIGGHGVGDGGPEDAKDADAARDAGVAEVRAHDGPAGDSRSEIGSFDKDTRNRDTRNVMPLRMDARSMSAAGVEPGNIEPRPGERWAAPRDRPRLNVVRASDADLARSTTNTQGNPRHR